jgi:hypothetical protein
MGGGGEYNVLIDGVQAATLGTGSVVRLDLPPGQHAIQVAWSRFKSDVYTVIALQGLFADLICGEIPGSHVLGKLVIRSSNGALLSPTDSGKPFRE